MKRDRYGALYASNDYDSSCLCGHPDRAHDDTGTRRCRVRIQQCDCNPRDAYCDERCDCPGYEPKGDE